MDVYPNETNLTVWIIGEDGQRHRFVQDFAVTIYAAGPSSRLRELWKWLQAQPIPVHLSRTERRDVFQGMSSAAHVAGTAAGGTKPPRLTTVLAAEVCQPAKLDELFRSMVAAFPDLTYYDADISIPLRHAAAFDVFPLARCRLELQGEKVVSLTALNTPWELEPEQVPLRILSLEPDCDPAHGEPQAITIACERIRYSLPLEKRTPLLVNLAAELRRYDPDVILTSLGRYLADTLPDAGLSRKAGLRCP